MASLRRSKTLSPDGQTARFLYTILKQLDLKAIDWNLVADSLDITNGHAARMRFSRFKQHMEGIPTQPRAARPKKESGKEGKSGKDKGMKRSLEDGFKGENEKGEDCGDENPKVKEESSISIKVEPGLRDSRSDDGEPPPVKVKRESDLEGITSQGPDQDHSSISSWFSGNCLHTSFLVSHHLKRQSQLVLPRDLAWLSMFSYLFAAHAALTLCDIAFVDTVKLDMGKC